MTAIKPLDVALPFALKTERDENIESDDDDINSVSSLPLPLIQDNNSITDDDPEDEFLRLTTMVRGMYFTYLYKSLLSNYVICCETRNKDASQPNLKMCAGQMELNAVRASLEASLYRQAMLKMISDIKVHTSRGKVHGKLARFMKTPPNKVDVAVQTNDTTFYETVRTPDSTFVQVKDVHVQSSSVTSNYNESVPTTQTSHSKIEQSVISERISVPVKSKAVPIQKTLASETTFVQKTSASKKDFTKSYRTKRFKTKYNTSPNNVQHLRLEHVTRTTKNSMQEILGDDSASVALVQNENDDSQDSLMQHLEDMFCESDDSSDLMTLIEKHSGVSKANVDLEIGKMCPKTNLSLPAPIDNIIKNSTGESSNVHINKRKLSFSNYKKMKKQETAKMEYSTEEGTIEERKRQKISNIWFVERVHQVSKLKTKMTEISLTNYRKHGRIKAKFIVLFGESDEEDMMPDSPICIEEHLIACKERIAPWVVKYLMSFYKKGRIADRRLFKVVAKHIADMLIIKNTFPEEDDVNKHILDYFRNKKCIKMKSDIYI